MVHKTYIICDRGYSTVCTSYWQHSAHYPRNNQPWGSFNSISSSITLVLLYALDTTSMEHGSWFKLYQPGPNWLKKKMKRQKCNFIGSITKCKSLCLNYMDSYTVKCNHVHYWNDTIFTETYTVVVQYCTCPAMTSLTLINYLLKIQHLSQMLLADGSSWYNDHCTSCTLHTTINLTLLWMTF